MKQPQVYTINGNLWYNVSYPLPEHSEIVHGALCWTIGKGDTVTGNPVEVLLDGTDGQKINKDDLPLVLVWDNEDDV